jgi:hypothetical protein
MNLAHEIAFAWIAAEKGEGVARYTRAHETLIWPPAVRKAEAVINHLRIVYGDTPRDPWPAFSQMLRDAE